MNFEFFEEKNFKDTELGPIPEDWEVVRLGEVCEVSSGGSAPQGDKYFGGKNFFIRVQHIDNEYNLIKRYDLITDEAVERYKLKLYSRGTIIFPKSGATVYLEKRAKLPFDAYIVSHLCAVNTKTENLSQDFLYYTLLNTKFAEKKGDGYPTLNLSEIRQFFIPLPPLSEQKAIAEVLSTIQEARERTEEVIKATKELKKSMMKHLFTYGPVSLDEIDKVKLKETEIGLLPEHWEVVKLGDLTNNNLQPKEEQLAKIRSLKSLKYIPFIPMSLIPDDLTYINKWELKLKEEIRSGIPIFEGDLLLAKITPCFENGKQGIIKGLPDGIGYATTEVIPLRLKKNMVSTEYLSYYLRFPPIRSYLTSKMEGTTGRKRLPKSQLENLSIPLPPLSEQQTISNILQAIDEKIQREEERKKALENLFKSMLHNLMSGRIRVKILEAEVL